MVTRAASPLWQAEAFSHQPKQMVWTCSGASWDEPFGPKSKSSNWSFCFWCHGKRWGNFSSYLHKQKLRHERARQILSGRQQSFYSTKSTCIPIWLSCFIKELMPDYLSRSTLPKKNCINRWYSFFAVCLINFFAKYPCVPSPIISMASIMRAQDNTMGNYQFRQSMASINSMDSSKT